MTDPEQNKLFILPFLLMFAFSVLFSAHPAEAITVDSIGQIALPGSDIARIATDSKGNVYITDSFYNSISIYSNNGHYVSGFGVERPLGIDVDDFGRIFVGSGKEGSVSVFDSSGGPLYKLGSGDGEFGLPSDIAIGPNGFVYVTDSKMNLLKAYDLDGVLQFTRGGLSYPTGLAVDDAAGMVYVSDHNNSRIRVYDLGGTWKRNITNGASCGMLGCTPGKFLRPQGLALDSTRLYISDAFHSTIAAYTKAGSFVSFVGNYGKAPGSFKTPLDAAFDPDGKLFVTNSQNQRVEVLGIDSYTNFSVSPKALEFSVIEGAGPVSAQVSLLSNKTVQWSAFPSQDWVTVSPVSGDAPSTATVTVDPSGMAPGLYSSEAAFRDFAGTEAVLRIALEVRNVPLALSIVPSSLNFKYQQTSTSHPSQTLLIGSTGRSLSWSASASVPWLSMDNASGETPSSVNVGLNGLAEALVPWTYDVKVTFSAPGVSPVDVGITVNVINAGTITVKSNLDDAAFSIKGPAEYSATGKSWGTDEAPPGEYSITFSNLPGYLKPLSRTFGVQTGKETVIDGAYLKRGTATHIVTAQTNPTGNSGVKLFDSSGQYAKSLYLIDKLYAIEDLATGDLDGDGVEEIVLSFRMDGTKGVVRAFDFEGKAVSAVNFIPYGAYPVDLALGDLDGDSKDEIIAAAGPGAGIPPFVRVFKYENWKLIDTGIYFRAYEGAGLGALVSAADVDGDGADEIIIASGADTGSIKLAVWKAENPAGIWSAVKTAGFSVSTGYSTSLRLKISKPAVSGGDLDGDGFSEIVLAVGDYSGRTGGWFRILKYSASGSYLGGFKANAWDSLSLDVGDTDMDGGAEIAIADGYSYNNVGTVRVFEGDGTPTGVAFKGFGLYGGVLSLGRFK